MAPSLLQIAFVFFLPESPRFLMSKDRHEEASRILIKYHGEGNADSDFVKAEIAEVKTTIALEMEQSKRSWLDMLRTAGMRRRVLIGSLLGVFTQLSGNVVISYYLGDCLKLIGYTNSDFQAKYNLGKECFNLVCAVTIALFVMKFKRRTMYMTGILAYLVELFPFATRARGIAIFQFFGKAAQFFGTNVNPIGFDSIGWKWLLVYCCWIFVEAVLIWFLWPETSGRTLEELAFLFEDEELAHRTTAAVEKQIHGEELGNPNTTAEHREA
ncbi:putative mfs sugar protein [Phaeoacremonium minimum UCRPA7]|uniref:Putative mfs sugar protein n=1 Tax=Phaeoacremonium minimum (strain UCR-PA7) TaxID=1286976 RepID=R8BQ19_PHAM7|nr:putative mfs sugar protein [Phaeoacremonium minimum UCRPA7]EOO01446.1 putative mfs sugar protein [Phaeoacremonium minimum UCRPA7]